MADKTADNVTAGRIERIVTGSRTLFILDYFTENLDDADTIAGVGSLVSNVDGCWLQTSSAGQTDTPRLTRSGTGNTTITFNSTVSNWNGQVFILGTP